MLFYLEGSSRFAMEMIQPISMIGDYHLGGCYLFRIQVSEEVYLRFGQYREGELVTVPAGDYVYVGSAQSQRGSSTLANRLLRHATRSGDKSPHLVRKELLEKLRSEKMGGVIPQNKNLHWHVDYLLDLPEAEIGNVIVLRGSNFSESRLVKIVEDQPETFAFAPGLGASDDPGSTHLLAVQEGEVWWCKMVYLLEIEGV
jgi:Uri superfamily endonuclease